MFEALFKYPQSLYDGGTLLFASLADPLWWGGSLALAAVLIVVSVITGRRVRDLPAHRRIVLAGLQIAAFALVVLLLLQPSLQVEVLKPGVNRVAVVVDTSASMGFADSDPSRTRLQTVQSLLDELVPGLSEVADVDTFVFARSTRRLSKGEALTADGSQSRIVGALGDVLSGYQGAPLAAVVVLTDGADTSQEPSLERIGATGVPVHAIGVGPTALDGEVQIADVSLPVDVPPYSQVDAIVTVAHNAGERVLLRVVEGGQLLAARPVVLPAGTRSVRAAIGFDSGGSGLRDLAFEIVPDTPGDLTENNRVSRLLTVSERQRQVLYIEGEPRWEYKFVRRALAGDDVLTMKSVLKTTDRKTYRQGVSDEQDLLRALPDDRATLFGYDLVVLGSVHASEFDAKQHALLAEFVSTRGGSLLVLAGPNSLDAGGWASKPLAQVLPVKLRSEALETLHVPGSFRARLTRDGQLAALRLLPDSEAGDPWATLPELADLQHLGAPKPAARTLLDVVDAAGATAPLLVVHPYGLGTAAVLATSSTWRWQMRTPADDSRHRLFWRQLLRHLAEQAQRQTGVTLTPRGSSLDVGVALREADFSPMPEATLSASVTAPDGTVAGLNLQTSEAAGIRSATYRTGQTGVHKVDVAFPDGSTTTRFARLGASLPEYFSPVQNVAFLNRLAGATGGAYWTPATSAAIPAQLGYHSAGVRERRVLPLWDMPVLFALLLLLKSAEWWLRRRWGRI